MSAFFRWFQYQEKGIKIWLFVLLLMVLAKLFFSNLPDELNFPTKNYFDSIIDSIRPSHEKPKPIQWLSLSPQEMEKKDWERLGFSDKQAQALLNYTATFKTNWSYQKLLASYIIDTPTLVRIMPYLQLPTEKKPKFKQPFTPFKKKKKKPNYPKNKTVKEIELNTANFFDLQTLFDKKIANRILKYRELLGGFYATNQLLEVFEIDTAKFKAHYGRFKLDKKRLKKININQATYRELLRHPYFNQPMVKELTNYRKFKKEKVKLEEIPLLKGFDEDVMAKLKFYLEE